MKNFTFSFPTQVIFGRDAETHAGALSAPFGPNVMLLYGSDRIRRSGLLLAVELGSSAKMFRMMELFKEAGILSDWFLYCDTAFRISPPLTITEEEVRDSARLIRECLDRI